MSYPFCRPPTVNEFLKICELYKVSLVNEKGLIFEEINTGERVTVRTLRRGTTLIFFPFQRGSVRMTWPVVRQFSVLFGIDPMHFGLDAGWPPENLDD